MLYCNNPCVSQKYTLKGHISDGKENVEYASIILEGTHFGSKSNVNGEFEIHNIPSGEYNLLVSFIGFEKYSKTISIDNEKSLHVEIILVEETAQLEAVVISGTMLPVSRKNSPVSIEVYSTKYFEANPTPSLFESMQNINGVRPQLNCNICNTGDIHINGLEGPYTMVLIDGMPIVSGLSTVYGLSGIPQALIERVEIVKGPASTLYGSEAVGGLINIITKNPTKAARASVNTFATDWGEYNVDLGYRFNIGSKVNSLLGINYFNYKNPIDKNEDGFTDVTLQDRISIFNKWSLEREKNRHFSIAGRFNYEDRWGGEMNWSPEFRGGDSIYGESIYTERWELISDYQLPTSENIHLQISANAHLQNSVYGNTVFKADQYIGFGQVIWNKTLSSRNNLLLGSSMRFTYYDDNTRATESFDTINLALNRPSESYISGVFVQNEFAINPYNKLLTGLRFDHNSIHGLIFSPRINYKWNSQNELNVLRLSLGNGFRIANIFTEDHAALTGARDVIFKEELKPEKSWNANLNYVKNIYHLKSVFIDLDMTVFYTYFTNQIIANYDENPNQIIYQNSDGFSVSRGGSMNLNLSFINGLNVMLGTTFQNVFQEIDGKNITPVLTESVSGVWNVNYTFSNIKLKIDYTGNIYGPMRLPLLGPLDDRREYSPWWSLQNIQITKELSKGFEIFGGIKNLLNYRPPSNSIARSHDPFDKNVLFDGNGNVLASNENPKALTFDPNYVFAPNQGIRTFAGLRYIFD